MRATPPKDHRPFRVRQIHPAPAYSPHRMVRRAHQLAARAQVHLEHHPRRIGHPRPQHPPEPFPCQYHVLHGHPFNGDLPPCRGDHGAGHQTLILQPPHREHLDLIQKFLVPLALEQLHVAHTRLRRQRLSPHLLGTRHPLYPTVEPSKVPHRRLRRFLATTPRLLLHIRGHTPIIPLGIHYRHPLDQCLPLHRPQPLLHHVKDHEHAFFCATHQHPRSPCALAAKCASFIEEAHHPHKLRFVAQHIKPFTLEHAAAPGRGPLLQLPRHMVNAHGLLKPLHDVPGEERRPQQIPVPVSWILKAQAGGLHPVRLIPHGQTNVVPRPLAHQMTRQIHRVQPLLHHDLTHPSTHTTGADRSVPPVNDVLPVRL